MADRDERDRHGESRVEEMIREIQAEARMTSASTGCGAISQAVLEALRRVPRERFLPEAMQAFAYDNTALGIGHGQTISQPFIVALMTELLDLQPDDRVLEVGTGSGYQAPVLAELVSEVYSIEAVADLADAASQRLAELGYGNVRVAQGDGRQGWPDAAPFEAITVTAAAREIPPALTAQLAEGGRMVLPVGSAWGPQTLIRITRDTDGELHRRRILPVAFVPLTTGGS